MWGTDGTLGTNLNVNVETMTNTNLEDVDFAHSESKGISLTIDQGKKEQPLGKDNFNTVGIQYSDSGHDKAQTTYATIGAGNVTVGGEALGEDSTLNRDATKTQEITRARELGGTNINLTVDTGYLTDTKAKLAEDQQNLEDFPGNLRTGLGTPHYLRNEKNNPDNAKEDNGGIEMSPAENAYHGEGNTKYISQDGHDELVVDR